MPNQEVTGTSVNSRKTKQRKASEEPQWLKQLRVDAASRHEEKMNLLKQLIDVLKK